MSKNKKPIYKRVWFWVVAVIVVVGTSGGADTDNSKETNSGNAESVQEVSQSNNENTIAENESEDKAEDTVPKEYKSALSWAKMYSDTMHMSKAEIYETLLRRSRFTEEAAQYAIDNVGADWKENALEAAKALRKREPILSSESIYELLTFKYGKQFTPEEAQYAIDNLD